MRNRNSSLRAVFLLSYLLLFISHTAAFYLPGVAPTTYKQNDRVPVHVNRLTPGRGPLDGKIHTAITRDYYDARFHFCRPGGAGPKDVSESLGSILFGDRIMTSPLVLKMRQNMECKILCGPKTYQAVEAKFVNNRIYQNLNINWLVDGLPAAYTPPSDQATDNIYYNPGFPLGHMKGEQPVFHNHYNLTVEYHKVSKDQFRVVGVNVLPASFKNTKDLSHGQGECRPGAELVLKEDGPTQVYFSYSVDWRPSKTPFATRWDKYLHVYDPKIHWFMLVNSAIIVVFLSALVFFVLIRALRKDISRYNKLESYSLDDMSQANGNSHDVDDLQEDSGWKLVHGDVFRPPSRPLLLSVLIGNGAQLFMMTGFTIAFALFGFLSPSNRGSLGSAMILLYTLFGTIGGFVSTYTYKNIGATDQLKLNVVLTPTGLPGVVFATFFVLNLLLWASRSSGAVPFTTMLILVLIWFVISVPLSLFGSWLALKRRPVSFPCRTNQIPRQIPDPGNTGSGLTGFLQRPTPSLLLTGILPFGAIFIEAHFIMTSLWSSQVYYMFGFLFVCFALMILTCASVTVLNVYFMLCAEDYRWQWRSFFTSGACAFYVFINALVFWASRLDIGIGVSGMLYLGYSALISLLIFILTGTVGFMASSVFVLRIYRSIKVD